MEALDAPSGWIMDGIVTERVCAEVEGGVTVFLIGMRLNRPWKPWRWLPVMLAMSRMLGELRRDPALGLLATNAMMMGWRDFALLQYWRSAEHLTAYAHAAERAHMPAWRRFNAAIGSNGDVGIWHETYVAPPGMAESVFVNMPRFGLGAAGVLHPAKGERSSAAKRLRRRDARDAGAAAA